MTTPDLHFSWLFLPLLAAGFFLPGFLLGRLIPSPARWLSSFLGSAVVLFYLVLGLDTLHLRIAAAPLFAGLAMVSVGLLLAASKFGRPAPPPVPVENCAPLPAASRLWMIPPLLGLAAVVVRATFDPLSGYDNAFRWDFIARQMLALGNLAFYPPVTADDFLHYGWCDGIPPLVPVLNLWSYCSARQLLEVATAPRVILEAVLLFHAVWRLARGCWGAAAGWPATAVLATSACALWGVAMGQETGLTALTLLSMLVFLDEHRRTGDRGNLFWAGVAAGAGALSREYALAWPLLGLAALIYRRTARRDWITFGATAAVVAAPWYVRNWIHTGNPLFSYDIAGIFPVNPVHLAFMEGIGVFFRGNFTAGFVAYAAKSILVLAGFPVLLALWASRRAGRAAWLLLAGAGLVVGLWAWSVPQTAGGWAYASRVLTPAIAIAAVLAGGGLARAGKRAWPALLCCLLAGDAALRSWQLPREPLLPPWQLSFTTWLAEAEKNELRGNSPMWAMIADIAAGRGIIVDHPGHQISLLRRGAKALPLQSPEVAVIFARGQSFAATRASLRADGIRFILLTPTSMSAAVLIAKTPFLTELIGHHPSVLNNPELTLFDLDLLGP